MLTARFNFVVLLAALLIGGCSKESPRPVEPTTERPPSAPNATTAPPVSAAPTTPPVAAPPTTAPTPDPTEAVDGTMAEMEKELSSFAQKLTGLQMTRNLPSIGGDQQFGELLDQYEERVAVAEQALEELRSATGEEAAALTDEVAIALEDIAQIDSDLIKRLQELQ